MIQKFLLMATLLLLCGCSSSNTYLEKSELTQSLNDAGFHQPLDFSNIDFGRLNAAVFYATNEARAQNGGRRLRYHPVLEEASDIYAKKMAREGWLAHEDPNGPLRTPKQRVEAAGAESPYVAENLATLAGFPIKSGEKIFVLDEEELLFSRSPTGKPLKRHTYASLARHVVQQWLDSPGHRKNLLSPDAMALGCGSGYYKQGVIPSFVMAQNFQLFKKLKTR